MSKEFGFIRVTAVVPRVSVADPVANTDEVLARLVTVGDSDIVVFPELGISSYTCGRLFHQAALLDATEQQLVHLAQQAPNTEQLIIVGAPIPVGTALYNCAVVINNGQILGVVPKQYIPNYNEFYEARYFAPAGDDLPAEIMLGDEPVAFGTRLLFTHGHGRMQAVVHAEVCEDIWMPVPPSSLAAGAGANILCNLSASPETVGKAPRRQSLVESQSNRCQAAYVYTSCGPTESTADLVFGGHALIAEGGTLLAESTRVGDGSLSARKGDAITVDIDVERLNTDRRTMTTFAHAQKNGSATDYQFIPFKLTNSTRTLSRPIAAHPFVPANADTLAERCTDVFGIQTMALAKRIDCLGKKPNLVIGISGGLDSTLALLVAARTVDMLGFPRDCIRAVTMPGFGTTSRTLNNARDLMRHLDVQQTELDVREACLAEYRDLSSATGYKPFNSIDLNHIKDVHDFISAIQALPADDKHDLTFENVQARRRTELLMNMGFVLGTGDMSEMWLGWCTYNADHQSMYNVNCSVPKTLVRFMVDYVANHEFDGAVRDTLLSIKDTEISPELLPPGADGDVSQSTEATVGPYELHDFFMFYLARFGFSPAKVFYLAQHANGWSRRYDDTEIKHWLGINLKRAFAQQYKRDDVPNGPKVGSLSLSPRGDWRMPSDASVRAWLDNLEA